MTVIRCSVGGPSECRDASASLTFGTDTVSRERGIGSTRRLKCYVRRAGKEVISEFTDGAAVASPVHEVDPTDAGDGSRSLLAPPVDLGVPTLPATGTLEVAQTLVGPQLSQGPQDVLCS